MYFRDGKAGLLDWQAVRRGHPSRELAYTLEDLETVAVLEKAMEQTL